MPEEDGLPITGSEITAGTRAVAAIARALRRPEPRKVLQRRAEVKAEIRQKLQWPDGGSPEVLIVNHKKYDDYGKVENRLFPRGSSDWFKAEAKGLDDRGLEVYSAIENVVIRKGKARRVDHDEPGARQVWVVGRIRYERITHIDWEPDPNYWAPRFYTVYSLLRHEAFREVVLYEGDPDAYQRELTGIEYVGSGRGPVLWLRNKARHARFVVGQRRRERKWRDERYRND